MNKTAYISAAALLLSVWQTSAQVFNPSVEVTNDFMVTTGKYSRVTIPMTVPDSLTVFDMSFDYDVFSSPYKGAYEFTPYLIHIQPSAKSYDGSRFYLKAGAGWGWYPSLTALWCDRLSERLSMSVFEDFQSYFGRYRSIGGRDGFEGYDLDENLIVSGSYDFNPSRLTASIGYEGIGASAPWFKGFSNSVDASARLQSRAGWEELARYDMRLDFSHGGFSAFNEEYFRFSGTVSPFIYLPCEFVVDYNIGYTAHNGGFDEVAYNILVAPRAEFQWKMVRFSTGFKTGYMDALHIYPDLRVEASFLSHALDVYAAATGGEEVNTYRALKKANHFLGTRSEIIPAGLLSSARRERLNAYLGVCGCTKNVFQYDVHGGWASVADAPFYSPLYGAASYPLPVLTLKDYRYAYIDASFNVDARSVTARGAVHYKHTNMDGSDCFTLPAFAADGEVAWNIRRRLRIGTDFDFASVRHSTAFDMPAYVDLGLNAEYKTLGRLSFWLRLGNLLNQEIQYVPYIAERGFSATAGIVLDLR